MPVAKTGSLPNNLNLLTAKTLNFKMDEYILGANIIILFINIKFEKKLK